MFKLIAKFSCITINWFRLSIDDKKKRELRGTTHFLLYLLLQRYMTNVELCHPTRRMGTEIIRRPQRYTRRSPEYSECMTGKLCLNLSTTISTAITNQISTQSGWTRANSVWVSLSTAKPAINDDAERIVRYTEQRPWNRIGA